MRILLTGTAGQVGGALLPLLLKGKHTVIAPEQEDFDLSKPELLASHLEAVKPDLIINPAAYTAVDKAEDETALAFVVNGEAPGELAMWAAARSVPMIHFSTDFVFDGSVNRSWREEDPTGPLSVYGRSKLAGEEAVRGAGGPHLIIRTAWVYGARGANFMRTMIRLARERDTLRVVADQHGTPTSTATIATSLVQILEQGAKDLPASFARADGLVHLTNSGSTNWHGFAVAIVDGLKSRGVPLKAGEVTPITTAEFPSKAKRPANSHLDLTRLKQVYGVIPSPWESSLAAELDAFLALEAAAG
jgi:dTDP-4-dehydrorhamnose reductase